MAVESEVTLLASLVDGNDAVQFGGGLFVAEDGTATVESSVITANTAESGAGLYVTGALSLVASEVADNDASNKGGGLAVVESTASVEGTVFARNEGLLGGGLSLERASATLSQSDFTTNQAYHGGGAYLTSDSSAALTEVIFDNNLSITEGGGLYLTGSCLLSAEVCSFSANSPDDSYRVGQGVINWGLSATFVCDADGCRGI